MASDSTSWQQALQTHPELAQTAAGLYHLGTLALQQKQFGSARAFLEAAAAKAPSNSVFSQNLDLSRRALTQGMGSASSEAVLYPARSELEALGDALGTPWAALGMGLLLCALAFTSFRRSRLSRPWRETLRAPEDWGLALGLLLAVFLSSAAWTSASQPPAYFIEKTTLRAGPATSFPEVGSAEGGTQARFLGRSDDGKWLQLRFKTQAVGWTPAESVVRL